jgi:tRNA pseudouridine38-40 synthase
MNRAAKILFDYKDFTSFSKLHSDTKTNECQLYRAEWIQGDSDYVFIIKADRFLRNMVRAITGTLLEVGKNKLTLDQFRNVIERRDRKLAGMSVPAHGLSLIEILYP